MTEIADRLVPQDGLTDAQIKFSRFEVLGSGALIYFAITDEDGKYVGEFPIEVHPSGAGTIDELVATAHRNMVDVLRQWIYVADLTAQEYEKRGR